MNNLAIELEKQSIPDVDTQNDLWFKAMCLMTKNTDFSELSSIIGAVASNMYNEYKLRVSQYQQISESLKLLDGKVSDVVID